MVTEPEARAAAREWAELYSEERHLKLGAEVKQTLCDSLADLLTRYAAKAVLAEAELRPHEVTCPASISDKWECDCERGQRIAALKEQAK